MTAEDVSDGCGCREMDRDGAVHEIERCPPCASIPLPAATRFASSKKDLEDWVKMEWCKVYDIEYIERDIIGTIQKLLPPNNDLVRQRGLGKKWRLSERAISPSPQGAFPRR